MKRFTAALSNLTRPRTNKTAKTTSVRRNVLPCMQAYMSPLADVIN